MSNTFLLQEDNLSRMIRRVAKRFGKYIITARGQYFEDDSAHGKPFCQIHFLLQEDNISRMIRLVAKRFAKYIITARGQLFEDDSTHSKLFWQL